MKSPILFEIIEEIKEYLNFDVITFNKDEMSQLFLSKFKEYVIISDHESNLDNCNII